MSFMNAGVGQEDGEEEKRPDGEVVAVVQDESRVDLRLLNAELNNSVHSESSIRRLKQNIKPSKQSSGKIGVIPSDKSHMTMSEQSMDIDQEFRQA